ncbi:2'-5' RNA ligase family protein [Algoriphagus confluentis]|uniref:2'-5' RNA ligase family protein n=1 Tax=Algoriphagus confluentis TaxID=1697556 RepID=A0ABQ6PPX7_9BACT|nr:2'-5' RNA ligase family protein [Algoriphagus confluentis]
MKKKEKYFLALMPPKEILEKAESIKSEIRDQFNVKYALKSPAHITLKMPFSYNEAKEEVLIEQLNRFSLRFKPFKVELGKVQTFGKRVVFLSVKLSAPLLLLQSALKSFCKKELHLVDELSDRNYHPHMTLAFKDLKDSKFKAVLELAKAREFEAEFLAGGFFLLKKAEGKWKVYLEIPFSEASLANSGATDT